MGSELDLEGHAVIKELLYGDAEQLDAGAGPDSGPIWSDQPDFSHPYFLPWDEEPERTYLKFFGTWADGEVLDVYFEVKFVAPDPDFSDPDAEIVVTPEPMGAVFLYGGQRSPMGVEGGTYGNTSTVGEFPGFDETAIAAKVPAGTPLEVGGEDLIDFTVRAGPLPFGEGGTPLTGAVPTGPGRYVLRLEVTWGGGSASLLHQIEVVPRPEATVPSSSPAPTSEGSVAIDIRRSSEETGDPQTHARLGDQDVWMCPDGWSLVNLNGETESTVFDCGQEDTFTASAGTPIVVSGDFASVEATARLSASNDRTPYSADDVPAIDAGSVVFFQYAVEWDDGSTASFWLLLTVDAPTTEGSPSIDPGVEAAPALRVRCGPNGTEVLTPVVAAQLDGLHIEPVDVPSSWNVGVFIAADPGHSYWSGSDGTDDEFTRPAPPGELSVACHDEDGFSDGDLERLEREAIPFLLVGGGGYFTPYYLDCPLSEQESVLRRLRGVNIEDAAGRLRGLPGVREDDVIELAGYDWEWGSYRDWRIVRDSRIVARLMVGRQGGGHASGWACASSGIAGSDVEGY